MLRSMSLRVLSTSVLKVFHLSFPCSLYSEIFFLNFCFFFRGFQFGDFFFSAHSFFHSPFLLSGRRFSFHYPSPFLHTLPYPFEHPGRNPLLLAAIPAGLLSLLLFFLRACFPAKSMRLINYLP